MKRWLRTEGTIALLCYSSFSSVSLRVFKDYISYKGYNILVSSLLSEKVKFRARLCLWTVQSACIALVNLADRLNVACIPQ